MDPAHSLRTMDADHDASAVEESLPIDPAASAWNRPAEEIESSMNLAQELPFLVTHWLAQYADGAAAASPSRVDGTDDPAAALSQIRRAAADLAVAFASLGSFGTALRPRCSGADSTFLLAEDASAPLPPATFADARRRWGTTCPPYQLESLVRAAALGSAAVRQGLPPPVHWIDAAHERIRNQTIHPESGRTMVDAIDLEASDPSAQTPGHNSIVSSLQRPLVVRVAAQALPSGTNAMIAPPNMSDGSVGTLSIASDTTETSQRAATFMRHYLEARQRLGQNEELLRSLHKSLSLHQTTLQSLGAQRKRLLEQPAETDMSTRLKLLDDIKESEENSNRVIQQLERQLSMLEPKNVADRSQLEHLKHSALGMFRELQRVTVRFHDPARQAVQSSRRNNVLLMNRSAHQSGLDRYHNFQYYPRSMGRIRQHNTTQDDRIAILKSRFSHAVTINTHLTYPVFCLRFDRTGRYFITGADDYLAKVFCLAPHVRPRRGTMDPSSLARGAVLVCTLRGHAGVINDIDVSSDNSFLATASEDGDCRIWGLKDGCPVAILRGHVDGCNMVSWSIRTPYRLVTVAADGFARCWDIREACLKRYRKYVGKRPEYCLDLVKTDGPEQPVVVQPVDSANSEPPLPPIPARLDNEQASLPPPLPPQPPQAQPINPELGNAANINEEPGQFVANDLIDNGVVLLNKLRHGASLEEQVEGPGTRARRSVIKVICLARCPHGGHFATGSDDGICRIWREEEDARVERVDRKITKNDWGRMSDPDKGIPGITSSANTIDLKGHISAITDLQYSSKGDRLLSASQKDGIVRIWSWNMDPSASEKVSISHIVIKLTNPKSTVAAKPVPGGPRRRPVGASSPSVSCDVAVWVKNDSSIITAQCEPIKQSSSTITAGSQYIFIWDSYSGNCLMGFQNAHTMQCPVLIPHPMEPSIFCSAGSDGLLKIWDANSGICLFSHKNTVDYGPVEAHEKGKIAGFLDGAFTPDGASLVLTDESGRISVYDSMANRSASTWVRGRDAKSNLSQYNDQENHIMGASSASTDLLVPAWMREQYFRNDYYDLIYDALGYCIERGSELPPHLAPRGVRCAHGGAAWSDSVNESFRGLVGPLPDNDSAARWCRLQLGCVARKASQAHFIPRGNKVSQYDPQTSILVHCDESGATLANGQAGVGSARELAQREEATTRRVSHLSSNWRWGDAFSDFPDEGNDDDEPDPDDEEFVVAPGRASVRRGAASSDIDSDEDDDEDLGDDDISFDSPVPRRSHRRTHEDSEDSDGEDLLEYMSTNNSPSGPFAGDYETYFFRMTNEKDAMSLSRAWLRRNESRSSYVGSKVYSPQLGDTVIYIPRAHQETVQCFPSLPAPWQNWPNGAVWPVVKCCIRHMRYRFPFKSYFKHGDARCRSIIAVLTLEVTGVPLFSSDDQSLPSFSTPSFRHAFELSVFENDQPDFLLPEHLFVARVGMVDSARANASNEPNPQIEALYRASSTMSSQAEDQEFLPWKGYVERFADSDCNDACGFDALEVAWEHDNGTDVVSAWEICRIGSTTVEIFRPCLSEEETLAVQNALTKIKGLSYTSDDGANYLVDAIFGSPVDETQYTDYSTRVEVPMDLSFIALRLATGFYSSVLSVVFDIHLIRENCSKYNGSEDPITSLANEMVKKFEELVLGEEERTSLKEYEAIATMNASLSAGPALSDSVAPQSRPSRSRLAVRNRSVLEDITTITRSSTRSTRRNNQTTHRRRLQRSVGQSDGSQRPRRSSRRVDQTRNERLPAANLEHSSLLASGLGRGRNRNPASSSGVRTRSVQQQTVSALNDEVISANRYPTRETVQRSNATTVPPIQGERRSSRSRRDPVEPENTSVSHSRRPADFTASPSRSSSQNHGRQAASSVQPSSVVRGTNSTSTRSTVATRYSRELEEKAEENNNEASSSRRERDSRSSRSRGALESWDGGESSDRSVEESRKARRSRKSRDMTGSADKEESEDEPFTGSISSRRTRRSQNVRKTTSGEETDDEAEPPRSRRTKMFPESSDEEFDDSSNASESAEDDASIVSGNISEERKTRARNGRSPGGITGTLKNPPSSTALRVGRVRGQKSYVDLSSSEFDDEEESAPEHFAPTPPSKRQWEGHDLSDRGSKRFKCDNRTPSRRSSEKCWNFVEKKAISSVGNFILDYLSSMDPDDIFAVPVAEAFPEVAKDYLKVTKKPMDFRTIREDRLPWYKSANELREDLTLVFDNCITYNGEDSEYSLLAESLNGSLDEIFKAACKEKNILLPRRW